MKLYYNHRLFTAVVLTLDHYILDSLRKGECSLFLYIMEVYYAFADISVLCFLRINGVMACHNKITTKTV
jgi:hypothetical protein